MDAKEKEKKKVEIARKVRVETLNLRDYFKQISELFQKFADNIEVFVQQQKSIARQNSSFSERNIEKKKDKIENSRSYAKLSNADLKELQQDKEDEVRSARKNRGKTVVKSQNIFESSESGKKSEKMDNIESFLTKGPPKPSQQKRSSSRIIERGSKPDKSNFSNSIKEEQKNFIDKINHRSQESISEALNIPNLQRKNSEKSEKEPSFVGKKRKSDQASHYPEGFIPFRHNIFTQIKSLEVVENGIPVIGYSIYFSYGEVKMELGAFKNLNFTQDILTAIKHGLQQLELGETNYQKPVRELFLQMKDEIYKLYPPIGAPQPPEDEPKTEIEPKQPELSPSNNVNILQDKSNQTVQININDNRKLEQIKETNATDKMESPKSDTIVRIINDEKDIPNPKQDKPSPKEGTIKGPYLKKVDSNRVIIVNENNESNQNDKGSGS